MLQHALDHTTSELVDTHVIDVASECFHYELDLLARNLLNYLLDNMVSIGIFNAGNDVRPNLINYLVLQARRQSLKSLLDHSAAILVT